MRIGSKQQSMQLYRAGYFGNKVVAYPLDTFLETGPHAGRWSIRYTFSGRPGGRFLLTYADMLEEAARLRQRGVPLSVAQASQAAPDEYLTIQGEVCDLPDGRRYLHGTTAKLPMRAALLQGRHFYGSAVTSILRQYLDAVSFDHLQFLLDRHPGHVVEFSAYSRRVGELGWNSLFWDVRDF